MNITNNINRFFFTLSILVSLYIIWILLSTVDCGFDITDQSYNILAAQHQSEIFSVIRHDGYYTGLLLQLGGGSLAYSKLFSIILLLLSSIWFGIEFYKYIINKFNYEVDFMDKVIFILPISIGSLSYYKTFLITPSYNWLALIGVILVATLSFRIVNNKDSNYSKYLSTDYLLISFAFSLSFMAKPSTAVVLFIIAILYIIYERQNINIKKALPSIIISTIIIVTMHIIFLDGGFSLYLNRLLEDMERLSIVNNITIMDRLNNMFIVLEQFFFENFYLHPFFQISIVSIFSSSLYIYFKIKKINNNKSNKIIILTLVLIIWTYSFLLLINGDLLHNSRLTWFRLVELLGMYFIVISTFLIFLTNKTNKFKDIKSLFILSFFLLLYSFSWYFGTTNNVIYHLTGSSIFIIASIIILSFYTDKIFDTNLILTSLSGFIIIIYIYFLIMNAYEHPYRLITNIKDQNQNVKLLGTLHVDKVTKKYIEDLQKISKKYNQENRKISLLDMTGGSPGANIILEAAFFDQQWLIGGYSGSNKYVYRILKEHKGTERLKKAWVLTAPFGSRKLDLNILKLIDLNFPNDYNKVAVLKTAHRNEVQELWIPKIVQ